MKSLVEMKDILRFLNKEFEDVGFYAIYEKGMNLWSIVCPDYALYMDDEELEICKEAVREKYGKEFRFIFCCIINSKSKSIRKTERWKGRKGVAILG